MFLFFQELGQNYVFVMLVHVEVGPKKEIGNYSLGRMLSGPSPSITAAADNSGENKK